MPPPSGSPAPAPERRLAVLLSHFRPCCEAPRATTRLTSVERHETAAAAEAEAGLSAPPCAAEGSGEGESSGGGCCVFCNIVAGAAPAFKLYEDDVCLCILDAKPLTAGHSLIIPKSHYPSLQTTPPTVLAAICSKLPLLGAAIMKATQCDAFNVLINNGEKAGQVIFHASISSMDFIMSMGPEGERNQLCVQIKASTVLADNDVRNESKILPPVLNEDSEATVETGA